MNLLVLFGFILGFDLLRNFFEKSEIINIKSSMNSIGILVGLSLALIAPPVLAMWGDKLFANPESIASKCWQQFFLALLFTAICWIVIVWENQPLSSIGLHPFRWNSVLWGLLFTAFLIFIYSPFLIKIIGWFGVSGFSNGLDKLASLPLWYLTIAVIIGGIVEEGLYRGYATERLSMLTGNYWLGSAIALIAFGLAHVPIWGWVPALTTILSGGLLTLLYLGTGDLLASIVAHIVTDSVGIILPVFNSRHR
jgi:uncharacterized protein